jgi:hypothetical protein
MDDIIPIPAQQDDCLAKEQDVKEALGPGGTWLDLLDKGYTEASMNHNTRDTHILTNVIGEQVHLILQGREGLKALVDADGRPSWLKERLGRNHENLHGSMRLGGSAAWAWSAANARLQGTGEPVSVRCHPVDLVIDEERSDSVAQAVHRCRRLCAAQAI